MGSGGTLHTSGNKNLLCVPENTLERIGIVCPSSGTKRGLSQLASQSVGRQWCVTGRLKLCRLSGGAKHLPARSAWERSKGCVTEGEIDFPISDLTLRSRGLTVVELYRFGEEPDKYYLSLLGLVHEVYRMK
ncbi:hypothetical protein BaRGS_00031334 [Batillaria attramentaria]|uniref:Uncharacterized protein n=1 Tax=Batillaria attramentaria TaxID=370345 RepID=A0ABD0JRB9_9CAEN